MSAEKPDGAIASVAVVLAVCCGVHALLLLVGGITLVELSLRSWTLAFGGVIVLALAVVRFRHRRCRVPAPPRDRTEGDGNAQRSRTG